MVAVVVNVVFVEVVVAVAAVASLITDMVISLVLKPNPINKQRKVVPLSAKVSGFVVNTLVVSFIISFDFIMLSLVVDPLFT